LQPETLKLNAIIEKTALFISKHSAQMEIMIKTKQKNNTQFDFLNYNSELNPYYKHVIKMIKSGKFMPHSQRKKQNSELLLYMFKVNFENKVPFRFSNEHYIISQYTILSFQLTLLEL
jgi:hypothetical protein